MFTLAGLTTSLRRWHNGTFSLGLFDGDNQSGRSHAPVFKRTPYVNSHLFPPTERYASIFPPDGDNRFHPYSIDNRHGIR